LMVREVTSFPLRKNRNYTNGCPCLWKEKAGIEKKHVPKLSMVEKKNKRSLCLWWYHIVATRVLRLPASRSCFFVCLFVCLFCSMGFWTPGLTFTKQVLHHLSHSTSPRSLDI
jgi:hypothetical protein